MKHLCLALLALGLSVSALSGQQLEVDSPGGSLTSDGVAPTLGMPFLADTLGNLDVEIGGGPDLTFDLLIGTIAPVSSCMPIFSGECIDLFIPSIAIAIPSSSPFGRLNSQGTAAFSFPLNNGAFGTFGLQAIVPDPTIPPIFVNFTAAAAFQVARRKILVGDDEFTTFDFSVPVSIYGQSFTNMTVSTNGWIRFGDTAGSSDFSESTTDLINGTVGGGLPAPCIGVLWDDLDMSNTAGQRVIIEELTPKRLQVSWEAAQYFLSGFIGDFSCLICLDQSPPNILMDYSGVNIASPAARGLIGLSAGDGGAVATIFERNLFSGGTATLFAGGLFATATTYYQNFNSGNMMSETLDLNGAGPLTFVGQNSIGAFNTTTATPCN